MDSDIKEIAAIVGVIVLAVAALYSHQDGVVLGGVIALLGGVFGAHIIKDVVTPAK